MSITRDFKLSLVAGRSVPLVINANQYDDGEIWRFTLLDENGQKYSPSTGSIIGLKSDGHIIANAGTVSSTGLVIIPETEQMTAAVGKNIFELLIDDDTHGTANFVVFVEPRPGADGTPSDSDLAVFQEAIDAAAQIGDASELVDDVAVLKSRMDEFTTLTDGSTTGDAELADIRVGADGTTYPNAGDAVRGQVSDLKNALTSDCIAENLLLNHWAQGGLNTNTGANINASNRCRCYQYIDFGKCLSYIMVTPLAGYEFNLFEYGSDASFIKYYGWTDTAKAFTLDTSHLYRIAISKTDQSNFTPSDVPTDVLTFSVYKKTSNIIEDITEESNNLFYVTDLATGKTLDTGWGITITKNEDGSLTFNGTASTTFPIRLMGAIDDTVPNVLANTPYYLNREYLGNNELTKFPYFAYKDANHSSFTTLYKDRVYSFGSNPMLYLRIGGTYSFNNDTFRFTVTKGDVAQPYTNHESLVAKDPVYQYWKKEYKGNQDGNIFFNIKVDRPMPFGSENIVSQEQEIECVLRLPSTYTANGKPTRLVLCCHGSGGYIDKDNNYWWHSNWNSFITALTDAGYACFDCNLYPTSVNDTTIVGEHYGSPLYVQNCKRAYDYIVENYNVYPEIFVHGCSMGGVAATSFAHIYPEITLAESSFAGRDFCLYIWRMLNLWTASEQLLFANAMGYDTVAELEADHLSHCAGYYPSLSLVKCENGGLVLPPDRETDFSSWMNYYAQLEGFAKNDNAGTWLGIRKVPYKAWNSWGDRVGDTKFETILEKAYNTGNSCVYYNVVYDSYTHTQMCYGQTADMNAQLIQFYKQFE